MEDVCKQIYVDLIPGQLANLKNFPQLVLVFSVLLYYSLKNNILV